MKLVARVVFKPAVEQRRVHNTKTAALVDAMLDA
jgi:hypothetical protein